MIFGLLVHVQNLCLDGCLLVGRQVGHVILLLDQLQLKDTHLFAGTLMMVGNLIYATAYFYKSMELCLLGRAITGLGAPRIINRRVSAMYAGY
jgi:hypothetical protein